MFYSALVLGFAGSLHCLGMCGPLSLLLPADKTKRTTFIIGRLIYNSGRITTYALMGTLVGWLNQSTSVLVSQKYVFLTIGPLLLLYSLLPKKTQNRVGMLPFIQRSTGVLKKSISKLHKKRGHLAQFLFGTINGLIPCGLVYAALGAAILASSTMNSMLFMVIFGLGTLPMMMAFGLVGKVNLRFLRLNPELIYRISFILIACIMIYKGVHISQNTPQAHSSTGVMCTTDEP